MNLSMYVDSNKNLMMFLPDDVTDEEIIAMGDFPIPDLGNSIGKDGKPTVCIDLSNFHATFSIEDAMPQNLCLI